MLFNTINQHIFIPNKSILYVQSKIVAVKLKPPTPVGGFAIPLST